MPNLRAMIDGTTLTAGAIKAKKPSPAAQHVSDHIQDPVGATKEGFEGLQEAKLKYDMARESMQRNLAPVQSVMDHVSQVHGIQPGMGTPGLGNGNVDSPEVDEDGNPIIGQPGQMNQPGQLPLGKSPQPGQSSPMQNMNKQRPSIVGNKPGVVTGPQQSVVPKKLGQAAPGGKKAQNSPQPKGAKPAPKGGKTGREVNVKVSASGVGVMAGGSTRLSTQLGLGVLRCGTSKLSIKAADIGDQELRDMLQEALKDKLGTSSGSCNSVGPYPWIKDIYSVSNYFVYGVDGKMYRQSYKIVDNEAKLTGDAVKVKIAYVKANVSLSRPSGGSVMGKAVHMPVSVNAKEHKKGCMCANCSKMNAGGKSRGAKKGWSTRGKGHLSKVEKVAHYQNMDAGRLL